jgi:hypothetical protein
MNKWKISGDGDEVKRVFRTVFDCSHILVDGMCNFLNDFHVVIDDVSDPQGSRTRHSTLFLRQHVQPIKRILNRILSQKPVQKPFCDIVSQKVYIQLIALTDAPLCHFLRRKCKNGQHLSHDFPE